MVELLKVERLFLIYRVFIRKELVSRIILIDQAFPEKYNNLFLCDTITNELGKTLIIKIRTKLIKKFKAFLDKSGFIYNFQAAIIQIDLPAKYLQKFVLDFEQAYLAEKKEKIYFPVAQINEKGSILLENKKEDKELLVKFIKRFCARHKLPIQQVRRSNGANYGNHQAVHSSK